MKGQWCYFDSYFSPEFCDSLITSGLKLKSDSAHLGVHGTDDDVEYRRAEISWMYPNEFPDLYTHLWKMAETANRDWFGFDIDGLEHVQFAQYTEQNRGVYKKHQDTFWLNGGTKHRKLTAVVQLTDHEYYGGCDLTLHDCEMYPDPKAVRKQGTVIFFPSWLYHSVSPIQWGNRYSAVAWFEGPKWR